MMLASLIIGFGWIAGIIWFLCYRKKLNDNPEKQKKMSILIAIGSVLSFIIMICSFFFITPLPETITLDINAENQQIEVGKEYTLTANVAPDDANTSYLEFIVDESLSATITQDINNSLQATLKPKTAGIIHVHAASDDVKSNVLTLEIIEPTNESETPESTESENTETENTETESTETLENTEYITTENTEDNPVKAEQDANNEISGDNETTSNAAMMPKNEVPDAPNAEQPDNTDSNTTTSIEAPQNNQTQEQPPVQQPEQPAQPSNEMVWVDDTAHKYHSKSSCSNMDAPYQVTKDQAIAMGKDACKKCY